MPTQSFRDAIQSIARTRSSQAAVFADFCRMSACAVSVLSREDEYLKIAANYSRDELAEFSQSLALLVQEMEGKPFTDVLGPFYLEVAAHSSKQARGEFYTPPELSKLIARMTVDVEGVKASGKPITVSDPACGSGGMILALAELFAPDSVDMLRVTFQDIKDQAPATSSTASSNYANGAFVDPNIVAYGTSNDQVRNNIKFDATYSRAFFGDYKTTISLFGESRSGHPFSYTMFDPTSGRSSVFGTIGSGSRYLLYVPTVGGDPRVSYDSAATQSAVEALINSTGLKKYQGRTAPRNGFKSKWYTRLDLHLEQEIPVPGWSKSRISVFADVDNFTNLLNKNWGQIREYSFPYNVAPVRVACLTAPAPTGTPGTAATNTSQPCAQYRYSANLTSGGAFVNPTDTVYSRQSLYVIRIGARFSF